jgi:hypothetical protein
LKFIENIFTLVGMDWVLFGKTFTHVQEAFRSIDLLFYEMVVVVTKEGNVLIFR